jgi:very-short-patch-repair endonuclease
MRGRGLNPIPQHPVGVRYLDFALIQEGVKLDIEVDGRRWHLDPDGQRKVSDRLRDGEMKARGWRVLRFWVHELSNDMEGCLDRIERELRRR